MSQLKKQCVCGASVWGSVTGLCEPCYDKASEQNVRISTLPMSAKTWDEIAPSLSFDPSNEEDFMEDEYCWMHEPGGWFCPECIQARRQARQASK